VTGGPEDPAAADASPESSRAAGEPALTPAEAELLIDAMMGFGAALTAHGNVQLPSLADFVR
jgi:hypothetical protein